MCLSPILVKNPNYCTGPGIKGNQVPLGYLKDTRFSYMYVPCGHCSACVQLSQNYLVQRAREEFKECHTIFITLTYQPSMIPCIEIGKSKHFHGDIADFQYFIKRLRVSGELPSFKYLCSMEYGKGTHRPHFHALLFFPTSIEDDERTPFILESKVEKLIKEQWKRRVGGTDFDPIYRPLSKFKKFSDGRSTYDCHLVTNDFNDSDDKTDVAFYVTKYCLKFDKWSEARRGMLFHNYPDLYSHYWSILRPRILISKGFGLTKNTSDFISRCIKSSVTNGFRYPSYFNSDGSAFALSPYYKKRYLTLKDAIYFAGLQPDDKLAWNQVAPSIELNTVDYFCPQHLAKIRVSDKRFKKLCDKLYNDLDPFLYDIDSSDPFDSGPVYELAINPLVRPFYNAREGFDYAVNYFEDVE